MASRETKRGTVEDPGATRPRGGRKPRGLTLLEKRALVDEAVHALIHYGEEGTAEVLDQVERRFLAGS